jgi:mono/diheme cytochrome c family protein
MNSPDFPSDRNLNPLKCVAAIALSALGLAAQAAQTPPPSPAQSQFFETKIRPILVDNCYKCHSSQAEKLRGHLSLEYRDSILKGGDTGPALVPGKPEESLLIKAVRYGDPDLQMPPKGRKLTDGQIEDLVTWVKMGAPDPRVPATASASLGWNKDRREHWSFQPLKKVAVPDVKDTNWVSTPVDSFVLAKLESKDMHPSPAADKRTLIRRATFDLTGLPPTPEEVQAFLDDTSPDAFAKVVDRLLASPRYGERWGRFWLDTARYSDTKGDIKANQEARIFPYSWTYRDYVIRAFNDDMPYNQFVLEQIAADRVPVLKDHRDLAALGFLALGPHFNGNPNDIINDRIDVVCKGFLGLTVTCARCHDHKFDPISQKDYYALHGIFSSSVEPAEEPLLGTLKMTPEYGRFAEEFNAKNNQLAADEAELRAKRREGKGGKMAQDLRKTINQLRNQIASLERDDPGSPPKATVLYDSTKPHDSYVFIRGEAENKGDLAPRRFLSILAGPYAPVFRNGSGRLELAYSIINPKNPLTARVLVNRVWQHHFGEGFVTTPDDLGNQSDAPSNQELLDYLSARFMQEGWSIKKLHRLIMLSSVYQESSENNPRYAQIDPQNRLLWRANIHRLEFEAVRDSILALGGQLESTMGGPPVNLSAGAGGYSHRRTIYGLVDRRNLPEVYSQFDFANPDITTGKRYETTVPQQALFMMNNSLVVELARKLVTGPEFRAITGDQERIKFLYERLFQRVPTELEVRLGCEFVDDAPPVERISNETRERMIEEREDRQKPGKGKRAPAMSMSNVGPNQLRPIGTWVKYAHALLQTNEALFID